MKKRFVTEIKKRETDADLEKEDISRLANSESKEWSDSDEDDEDIGNADMDDENLSFI